MSLAARLSDLSADARELADALCLGDGDGVTLHHYAQLTAHGDGKRVFSALDELVSARVLSADAERYRFTQRGFLSVLHDGMAAERRVAIHGRLADLLANLGGELLRRVHHLFEAGRDREGIVLLASLDLMARLPPLALLERAVQSAERMTLPARTLHRLRSALLIKAPLVPALDVFRRHVPAVLAQLERDSGLVRYRELGDGMPAQERLSRALTDTQQRYLALPEDERVFGLVEAIRELGRLSAAFCSVAVMAFDLELIESLPSLEPLLPLSPALHVVSTILDASRNWIPGRARRSRALYEQVLARIAEPDRAGLDESQHTRTRMGVHYSLGLLEASMGIAVEHRAQALEADREMRVNAWRVRQVYHLSQGDVDEARVCMRRAELLQLQENLGERYYGTTAALELSCYVRLGDLVLIKSVLDGVRALAARHAGWRPIELYGEAACRRLVGDYAGALPLIEAGLALARPGRHVYFGQLATAHVEVLIGLERRAEALARAREYLQVFEREQLGMLDHVLYVAYARALMVTGDHAGAAAVLEEQIAVAEAEKKSGLPLGVLFEARARVAIAAGDAGDFEHWSARCAAEYGRGRNPAVHARFTRLLAEARKHDVAPADPAAIDELVITADGEVVSFDTVHSRMRECVDHADRARTALTLLLQSTESSTGFLYGVRNGAVVLMAAVPECVPEADMQRWIEQCAREELDGDTVATGSQTGTGDEEEPVGHAEIERTGAFRRYTDQEGRCFESMLLVPPAERRLAGVLALQLPPGVRTIPPRALRAEIAAQLLDHGDVDGLGPRTESQD
jgi:tetratricopeptide (TPR) repeat protein